MKALQKNKLAASILRYNIKLFIFYLMLKLRKFVNVKMRSEENLQKYAVDVMFYGFKNKTNLK